MYICNQWGELIYDTDEKNKGWDGTMNNSSVEIGKYVYLIEIRAVFGEGHKFLGHLLLVR